MEGRSLWELLLPVKSLTPDSILNMENLPYQTRSRLYWNIWITVDTFNGGDTEATDAEYKYAYWILRLWDTLVAESGPLVNYVYLIETVGWAYSDIDYAEVIVESETAAIVRMEFSIYNADNVAYFSGVNFFLLIKQVGKWIFDAAVASGIPHNIISQKMN